MGEPLQDDRLVVISGKFPDEFTKKVNDLLVLGGWRVTQTEMSVTDHHYFAMLIKSAPPAPEKGSDGSA